MMIKLLILKMGIKLKIGIISVESCSNIIQVFFFFPQKDPPSFAQEHKTFDADFIAI